MNQRVKNDRVYWEKSRTLLPVFMDEQYEKWDGPFGGVLAQVVLSRFQEWLSDQSIVPEEGTGISFNTFYRELRNLGYTLPKSTDWAKTRITGIRKRNDYPNR